MNESSFYITRKLQGMIDALFSLPMRKKFQYFLLAVIAAAVIIFPIMNYMVRHGEAYNTAKAFIVDNRCIRLNIGNVINVSLGYFAGYYVKWKSNTSRAMFNLNVTGKRSSGEVKIRLKKKSGEWHTDTIVLTVDGKRINCGPKDRGDETKTKSTST